MLDWSRIEGLRDEIGADDFAEVVDIFIEEMEEEIAALRTGIPQEDLGSKLHFLKGSALNIGFSDFAAICEAGERAAAQGAFDTIDLPLVFQCYAAAKTEFLEMLKTRFAA